MRSRLAQAMSSAAALSLLVQQPAWSQDAGSDERRSRQTREGQCRTPAPLPQLGREARPMRQDDANRIIVTGSGVKAVPTERSDSASSPPPPPPPPLPVMVEAPSADMAVGAAAPTSAVRKRATARPDRIRPPYPRPRPQPRPQAGLLTASEHDDLLNPELYAAYVRRSNLGQAIPDLPQLDTARVLTVELRDRSGSPIGRGIVEVLCEDGNRLLLPTMSDGTVTLFPAFDRLSSTVRIRALNQDWRTVGIPRGAGGQRVTFTGNAIAAMPAPALDLVLAIDTTGSMGDEIRYLQSELASILEGVRARHPGLDLRVGFVFYRDLGDDYVTDTVPLTRDFAAAQGALAQRYAGGGGDYPEAMDQALIRAAGQSWRPNAVKSLLLVADAPPHDDKFAPTWLAAEHLRAKRVHIVPVAASGVADKAEYAMRAMAALTQSRYTFLTDDSGVGNPHAPPAIDCYLVTRLDALLRRVIDSQIAGRRIEPKDGEVIRQVGEYDKGRCIIPPGGLKQ